jgi:hypothetical protein
VNASQYIVLLGSFSRMCSRGFSGFSAYGLGVLLLAELFARLRLEMEENDPHNGCHACVDGLISEYMVYSQHNISIYNVHMITTNHGLRMSLIKLSPNTISDEPPLSAIRHMYTETLLFFLNVMCFHTTY